MGARKEMGEAILNILGMTLLILGGVTYVIAILLTTLSILCFRFSNNKYWEEKATLFGLVALSTLPLGGMGGALLLVRYIHYSLPVEWQNLFFLLGASLYGILVLVGGIYLLFRTPTRLD